MLRYIALVWDATNLTQQNATSLLLKHWQTGGTKWNGGFNSEGLCVLYTGESSEHPEAHRLQDQSGIVLGALFKRDSESDQGQPTPTPEHIDPSSSARIVGTCGRDLIESYWGSYVAIVRNRLEGKTWVIRSPLGSLPCLRTEFRGVHIYFSSMSDCAACEYLSFTVNWQYLARHLGKMRQSSDTGLNEVSELYYGQCVEIGRNLQRRMHRYWNPVDVARARRIQCARDAESFVRHTVKVCVHAWAACQKSVVLRLSGGLDSSILLSCLHDAPTRPHVVCINRYSRRSDSDEREFARLAAQSKGCELIELYRDPNFSFEKIFSSRPAERPYNYILQYSQILPEAELADARGAGAIFDGVFGDDLFFGGGYQLAAADYVHDFGLRPSLLPVIVSAARVSRLSVWKVLRVALSKGLFRQQWDPIQVAREFNLLMDEDVLRKLVGSVSETHPWYQKNRYVPPGKQSQIAGIMDRNVYDMPFADFDNVRHVSPLLSQPIAELCLQIPTYVLSRNGWDREVQRQAFSPDIPEKIARRRTKAGQEDFSAEVKRKNHALIRDVLMNGWLVESGLVDRAKLEAAFAGRSAGLDRGPARMSRLINIEVWLKTWMDNKLRVAA